MKGKIKMNEILKRLIIFLVRKKIGVKKRCRFQFDNQKSTTEYYWFSNTKFMKKCSDGTEEEAHVSLNWLLDDNCKVHGYRWYVDGSEDNVIEE